MRSQPSLGGALGDSAGSIFLPAPLSTGKVANFTQNGRQVATATHRPSFVAGFFYFTFFQAFTLGPVSVATK